jgi:hypothetical protein
MLLTARDFSPPYAPLMSKFQDRYRVGSTRLADWDYAADGWYFVTLCTKDKRCSLGHAVDGQIVLSDAGVIAETEMKAVSIHYENVIICGNAQSRSRNSCNWGRSRIFPRRGAA